MSELIDISKADKAQVLQALYNNSKQQGMGFLNQAGQLNISLEECECLLQNKKYFDYLKGRVMKVDLKGNELDTWGYDRDNGQGAAHNAINHLLV